MFEKVYFVSRRELFNGLGVLEEGRVVGGFRELLGGV